MDLKNLLLRLVSSSQNKMPVLCYFSSVFTMARFTMVHRILCLSAVIFLSNVFCSEADVVTKLPVLMPNVHVPMYESHICTHVKMDPLTKNFIVGFEPDLAKGVVHHILLFGCNTPKYELTTWNCGHRKIPGMKRGDPCASGEQVINAYAYEANQFQLPEGIGFEIGGDSSLPNLVLQIHYAGALRDNVTDNSGVVLQLSNRTDLKKAAILMVSSWDSVQPHSIGYWEAECPFNEKKVIHPFAFRVHTHKIGVSGAGYRVRRDGEGTDVWTLMGKQNPQLPQVFSPVFNFEPIVPGDNLAVRCTMNNTRDVVVRKGTMNSDEMCLYYLMYWVENGSVLKKKYCKNESPPKYSWALSKHFNNIPAPDEELKLRN